MKYPEELDLFEKAGVKVRYLKDIIADLGHKKMLIQAAAGNDLFTLMQLGK